VNPLSILSGGLSTSNNSRSGDASSGLNAGLQYNGAFQVGGTGNSQSQSATQDSGAGLGVGGSNTLVFAALGLAALVTTFALLKR
jgi:hypothetical protein